MDTYLSSRCLLQTVRTGNGGCVTIAAEQILRTIASTHSTLSPVELFRWNSSTKRKKAAKRYAESSPVAILYDQRVAFLEKSASCALVPGAGRRVRDSDSTC